MKLKRIFAAMSAALVMAFAMPLGATTEAVNQKLYTPLVAENTATLKKYLVLDDGAAVPTVTFSFEVEAGEAVSATSSTMEIKAGPMTGSEGAKPEVIDAVFTVSDSPDVVPGTGHTLSTDYSGKKYVEKEITFKLNGVTFTEPGIYRYKITEKALTTAVNGITQDTKTIYADVYVTDDTEDATGDPKLKIANIEGKSPIVFFTTTDGTAPVINAGANLGSDTYPSGVTKTDCFVNRYTTHDLYFAKKVSGNQASRDKFFEFTVNISGLSNGAKLGVDIANAVAKVDQTKSPATKSEYNDKNNPTEIEDVDSDGVIEEKFYLQHDQYIIIKGIPEGATYNVTEDEEDYKSTAAATTNVVKTIGEGTDTINFDDATGGDVVTENIYTGFKNEKQGIVPTGIVLSIVPVLLIGVAVTAGIILLLVRREKNAE
ncbi:MAG: hypothetical protein J6F31_07670 [Oscillospiraceae bacterium]|nr:hypothetical protein [Oscillospiraceae bacterium]